jgi:hypothetical protein
MIRECSSMARAEAASFKEKTMKIKLIYAMAVVAGLLALAPFLNKPAAASPASEHVSLTGWVSCTTCLMPNTCKAQTRLSCTQWWISQGASYVLVVGDKHYVLAGSEKELAKAAAANSVTVTGELIGNQVSVASVDWTSKHGEK